MKIKKIAASLLIFLLISASALGQRYENGLVDKVIALIGNEMIQLSAIEEEVQMQMMQGIITDKNLRCDILENMLVSKLMLNQAVVCPSSLYRRRKSKNTSSINHYSGHILFKLQGKSR